MTSFSHFRSLLSSFLEMLLNLFFSDNSSKFYEEINIYRYMSVYVYYTLIDLRVVTLETNDMTDTPDKPIFSS
jgi:hypothetical protein